MESYDNMDGVRMKVKLPHSFYIYASEFTLESILREISICAFNVFKKNDKDIGRFGKWSEYSVKIGNSKIENRVFIAQTWLIDMIYDLICYNNYGNKEMKQEEVLHLIALYNDYCNKLEGTRIKKSADIFLNVYGFFGEQKRFQNINELFEEFAREKYILDIISKKENPYAINVKQDILERTGFSSDDFSMLVFFLFAYFAYYLPFVKKANIYYKTSTPILSRDNFIKVIDKYSITIDEVRKSSLNRQTFYTNPIIKINDEYISSNPMLLLCLFTNCNYWEMRNLYKSKENGNYKFLNAFGGFFEMYVEEILNNCISDYCYKRIPEDNNSKRADWYLNINGIEFLVEQKSGLSLLGIKQNQTDIELLKEHILKNWGKAVKQLYSTQKALNLQSPIKIILVYEDYYMSECLDELFRLDESLKNDGKYWLVTIREFEMLLMTCCEENEIFMKIVNEKNEAEIKHSNSGRDLVRFFEKHQIFKNEYLYKFGIMKQFSDIKEKVVSNLIK